MGVGLGGGRYESGPRISRAVPRRLCGGGYRLFESTIIRRRRGRMQGSSVLENETVETKAVETEAVEDKGWDATSTFVRNPAAQIIHCGDNEVLIKHGSRSRFTKNIKDGGRTRLMGKILRNVNSPTTLKALHEQHVVVDAELEDSLAMIEYLRGQGVLISADADPTKAYLDTILGARSDLSTVRIGLVGSGSLGSRIVRQLLDIGAGHVDLLDDRKVFDAALEQHYFDTRSDALQKDRSFAECVGNDLGAAGFAERVSVIEGTFDDEDTVRRVFEANDFVICALEAFSSSLLHLVNSVAIDLEKPWISVYIDGSEALVGPICVPGETPCYNDFEIQHEATLGSTKDEYLVYKEALSNGHFDATHLALPPYLSIASGLAATGIFRFLTIGTSFLVGRVNRIDFERMSIDYENVLRLPRCPACGPHRPGYRHLFM